MEKIVQNILRIQISTELSTSIKGMKERRDYRQIP